MCYTAEIFPHHSCMTPHSGGGRGDMYDITSCSSMTTSCGSMTSLSLAGTLDRCVSPHAYHVMPTTTSCLSPHTYHLMPTTSCLPPHAYHLMPITSCLPTTSCLYIPYQKVHNIQLVIEEQLISYKWCIALLMAVCTT